MVGGVLGCSAWKRWPVLTSLNTVGLWDAWGDLNPASSPGLPAGDEMSALLRLNPCPAGAFNQHLPVTACVSFFVMGQEYPCPEGNIYTSHGHLRSGRTNHAFGIALSPLFREGQLAISAVS